jgi:acyl-CoA thioesterase
MPGHASAFDVDTAVASHGSGVYGVRFPERWSTGFSLSGGFVAALVVRAMEAELADVTRGLCSITIHFLATIKTEEGTVAVTVERSGRGVSNLTARVHDGTRPIALALAAFSVPFAGATEYDETDASLPPCPATLPPPPPGELSPPFLHNFKLAPVGGAPPFGGSGPATTGGWIELVESRPLDASLVVALADSWWPSPFSYLSGRVPAPTIDLTVHVRAPLPRPAGRVFSRFRSTLLQDGLFEEDGLLRASDGALLAQSRQLAHLLPASRS